MVEIRSSGSLFLGCLALVDRMNKSFVTNLLSFVITVLGLFVPVYGELLFDMGIFAFSGAITNWLAIYMLFEKVPLCYGSGVIPSRFEEFKAGIKQLIVQEFFTREHIERFFAKNGGMSVEGITSRINFDRVFEQLVDAILASPMGSMLGMFGGRGALEPLKQPIIDKLKSVIAELASNQNSSEPGKDLTAGLIAQIEQIIDNRLAELTPQKVKQIIEDMIRRHLGWLVVWGGVFGGAIGVIAHVLEK